MFRGIRRIRGPVPRTAYRVPRIPRTAVQHWWVEKTIWWERHAKKRAVRGIQVETRQRYAACAACAACRVYELLVYRKQGVGGKHDLVGAARQKKPVRGIQVETRQRYAACAAMLV